MAEILRGEATPAQIGAFLVALHMKGETVEEIVGLAQAIRAEATPLQSRGRRGARPQRHWPRRTGRYLRYWRRYQRHLQHFNRNRAGHRRSRRSRCQARQSQHQFQVRLRRCHRGAGGEDRSCRPARIAACLKETGIAFLYAPAMHSAMKHVQPVRRELKLRTVFNLLGPLTNPAQASAQVVGVYSAELVEKLAEALQRTGLATRAGRTRRRRAWMRSRSPDPAKWPRFAMARCARTRLHLSSSVCNATPWTRLPAATPRECGHYSRDSRRRALQLDGMSCC